VSAYRMPIAAKYHAISIWITNMSQEIINISNAVNAGTGDTLKVAFTKVNSNFDELFEVIEYETSNTVLTLTDAQSTFENSVLIEGQLVVDQDVTLLANVSALVDGGSF